MRLRNKWLIFLLVLAGLVFGYVAFTDSNDRFVQWRWALHYMHTYLDPDYYNATWYAQKVPSPNYGSRQGQKINALVIHYTESTTPSSALIWFCNPLSHVSSHYVINKSGRVFQLVPESKAAWHAGVSYWRGINQLNESAIGIELFSSGYEPYTKLQMEALAVLSQQIIERYHIEPRNVVAHSDISPQSKLDPGELFDWEWMSWHGISLWPQVQTKPGGKELRRDDSGPEVLSLQQRLIRYGYGLDANGTYDERTRQVVGAFQRHYRSDHVTGRWDHDCDARLNDLLRLAGEKPAN